MEATLGCYCHPARRNAVRSIVVDTDPGLLPVQAPVAQGIEHRPPEAVAQVRILPGAPRFFLVETMAPWRPRHRRTTLHAGHGPRAVPAPACAARTSATARCPRPGPGRIGRRTRAPPPAGQRRCRACGRWVASVTSPDQLLQHVLEEHHARHGAVGVHDPGQVRAGALHRGEHVLDLVAGADGGQPADALGGTGARAARPRRRRARPSGAGSRSARRRRRRTGSGRTRAWRRAARRRPGVAPTGG